MEKIALSGKPTRPEILSLLAHIARTPVAGIREETLLRADLKMDSLNALDLLVSLEERYAIVVPQAEAAQFKSVADIFRHLGI